MITPNFYIFIYLMFNSLSIYSKYKTMYIFFDECKVNKKIEIFLYVTYFFINSGLYLIFDNPDLNLIINIVLFFLLTFIYISLFQKKIIATTIVYALSFFIEMLIYNFVSLFVIEVIIQNTIAIIISRSIFYLAVFLFKNLKDIKANNKISFLYIFIISFISICTLYISIVLLNDYKNSMLHITFCIAALFIVNVFIIYIYDILNKKHKEELENKLLSQQNDFYVKQLKIMSDSQDNIRALKHNLKNHFISLKPITYDGEKINEYLNEFLEIEDSFTEYARSGNSVFDSILNYKLQEAKKKEIEFELELKIPYELNIKPYDVGVIVGNLLDNAIEGACKNETNKMIKINIYYEKGNLSINIINTFDGKIIADGKTYKTTNKNKIEHGFGLSSVEKAVKKYDGELHPSYEGQLFTVSSIMYIK